MMASASEDDPNKSVLRLPAMGRCCAHRNFRLFVVGQGISVLGTWMQQIATVWLVYRLSQFVAAAGRGRFHRANPRRPHSAAGRRAHRSLEPPSHGARHAILDDDPGLRPDGLDRDGRDQRLADPRPERPAGRGQRLRLHGPAVLRDRDGRRPRRSGQRHRHQFVGLQRRPTARPGGCRHRDRAVRRVALLSLERPELPGGPGFAAGDAGAAGCPPRRRMPASWQG